MTTETDKAEKLRRRRARERLKRAEGKLADFEYRLRALHADRSGSFRMLYRPPLLPDEFYILSRSISRNFREAAAGCPEALAWMEKTAELRAAIDTMRATPLPQRHPDFTGAIPPPSFAAWTGKRRPRAGTEGCTITELGRVSAEDMLELMDRKRCGRRRLEEFIAELAARAIAGG